MSTQREIDALLREYGATRSNAFIADATTERADPKTVGRRRAALGIPVYRGRGQEWKPRFNWSTVDFDRPQKDIAAERGCTVKHVSAMKAKFAPHLVKRKSPKGTTRRKLARAAAMAARGNG